MSFQFSLLSLFASNAVFVLSCLASAAPAERRGSEFHVDLATRVAYFGLPVQLKHVAEQAKVHSFPPKFLKLSDYSKLPKLPREAKTSQASKVFSQLLLALIPAHAFKPACPTWRNPSLWSGSCMVALRHGTTLLSVAEPGKKPANEVQCTFALIKNICGAGVLALPAGISRLSDGGAVSTEALGLALMLLVVSCALNALGFVLIGEACASTSEASYVGAWRGTIGQRTSFIPALASLLLCFTGAVASATVISDVGSDILRGFVGNSFEDLGRNSVLAATSVGVLTPLCLLPSLAPLGSASVLGVIGLAVMAGAMATRSIDGSYAPMGQLAADLGTAPSFHEAVDGVPNHLIDFPPSAGALFFFLSLVSNAYLAHYNAPGVFNECQKAALLKAESAKSIPPATSEAQADDAEISQLLSASLESRKLAQIGDQNGLEDGNQDLLQRLTSTLAAEEVNEQFQIFIESVPDFAVYAAGYKQGYAADFKAGQKAAGVLPSTQDEAAVSDDGLAANLVVDDTVDMSAVGLVEFRRVVTSAYIASFVLYTLIAWAGFVTFGDSSKALILNNYASADTLAQVARVGILLAVIFEFPLLERPFRLTALELLLPIPQFTGAITQIANGPLAAIISVAFLCATAATGVPLDTLSGLSGSTGGALLIYIAPALMKLKLRDQTVKVDEDVATSVEASAIGLWSLVVAGVALAIIGTADSLGQTF